MDFILLRNSAEEILCHLIAWRGQYWPKKIKQLAASLARFILTDILIEYFPS